MEMNNYLTKSRFKLAITCATKLKYLDDKNYGNTKMDDPFLKALANGGFQVGKLAQYYYPGGVEITEKDKEKAHQQTKNLLEKKEATVFEASILHGKFFIKTDVVLKKENTISLIEVKAKSFDSTNYSFVTEITKKGPGISSKWIDYIYDIAFQTFVFKKAYPNLIVTPYLMLADISKKASVHGLNQNFIIKKDSLGRSFVEVSDRFNSSNLGEKVLSTVDVSVEVDIIFQSTFDGLTFEQHVNKLAEICWNKNYIQVPVSRECKACEFRIKPDLKNGELKSGFEDCWKKDQNLIESDFNRPMIFDIWYLHYKTTEKFLNQKQFFMDQMEESDFEVQNIGPLSEKARRWIQIEKTVDKDLTPWIDLVGLRSVLKSHKFPLHFIDFETNTVAIPFYEGQRPYEQIAFQFSHHQMDADGSIIHKDEYINTKRGEFPNFEFIRNLKKCLENDEGTIFRFAIHENTVLCKIKEQLENSNETDRDNLVHFIKSITKSSDKSVEKWEGARNMVDMLEIVKSYYYHPLMKNSNSIKKVLPAILYESKFLQDKYSKPIYGNKEHIMSKNFENETWIKYDIDKQLLDPYKRLKNVFSDYDQETLDLLYDEDRIDDGGSAMTAYSRMQFSDMTDEEVNDLRNALLRYCELDTFAMVLIYEYWLNVTK
jgi:hypothetical protein